MITKAAKVDNVSISDIETWRVIMDGQDVRTTVKGAATSRTYTMRDIVEVPLKDLPDTVEEQPEQIPDLLKGMVFAGDLTEDELLAIMAMYQVWNDVEIGAWIEADDLVSHENKLYQVSQRHQKQVDRVPGVAQSLFTSVMPAVVVGLWEQRFAPPYYQVGDLVQWPEGTTWIGVTGDANGNIVWEPGVFGWTVLT